jgi:hypothetical protein
VRALPPDTSCAPQGVSGALVSVEREVEQVRLEQMRTSLVARRRRLDLAISLIDQALGAHQTKGAARRDAPEIVHRLSAQRRRKLMIALYETGSTLESLRQLTGLTKRVVRDTLGSAVEAQRSTLSDDGTWWSQQLDEGYSVAELAVAAETSTNRLYRHLTTLGVWPRPAETFDHWLEQRTTTVGDCLVWRLPTTGTQTVPMAKWSGRSAVVRRLVWEHHHGPVDDSMYVTATRECPEPVRCVAVHHSRLLTPHGASLERSEAGRVAHGEAHGNARLTEDQALTILVSPQSHDKLAEHYGVSRATVHAIKTGRRWKHLHREVRHDDGG